MSPDSMLAFPAADQTQNRLPAANCPARSQDGVPGVFTPSARSPEPSTLGMAYLAAAMLCGSAITNGAQSSSVTPAAQAIARQRGAGSANSRTANANAHGLALPDRARNTPVMTGRARARALTATAA